MPIQYICYNSNTLISHANYPWSNHAASLMQFAFIFPHLSDVSTGSSRGKQTADHLALRLWVPPPNNSNTCWPVAQSFSTDWWMGHCQVVAGIHQFSRYFLPHWCEILFRLRQLKDMSLRRFWSPSDPLTLRQVQWTLVGRRRKGSPFMLLQFYGQLNNYIWYLQPARRPFEIRHEKDDAMRQSTSHWRSKEGGVDGFNPRSRPAIRQSATWHFRFSLSQLKKKTFCCIFSNWSRNATPSQPTNHLTIKKFSRIGWVLQCRGIWSLSNCTRTHQIELPRPGGINHWGKAQPSVAIAIPWCVHKFNRAFYISTSTSKLEDNAQFA